mmetsp:Transcript_28412/g.65903  ORF Transcript_28412/g.65903 Transcript_28412/m.65903 type:complete len:368 (-) Transcript_28412:61-1164(-)
MMPVLREPLLPVEAKEDEPVKQSMWPSFVFSSTLIVGVLVGIVASPHLSAGSTSAAFRPASFNAAAPVELSSGPLGLGGIFGPVGIFLGDIYAAVAPYSVVIEFIGLVLYCMPFLLFGSNHAKDYKGFVDMMSNFGLPMPQVFAVGGLVSLIGGPILMLTMQLVLVPIGAVLISGFLVMSTYYGHVIPLQKAEAGSGEYISNFIMILKNAGLLGVAMMAGSAHIMTIMPSLIPVFTIVAYSGVVLFALAFLIPASNHAKDYKGFTGMMQSFGLPLPAVMAAGGMFCLIVGPVLLLTYQPTLMEWGAEFVLCFLIGSTYFGHYKPMKAASPGSGEYIMQFLNTFKNVGLMGGCVMIVGAVIPLIPAAS